MNNFIEIIELIFRTLGACGLGFGVGRMFDGDYTTASWCLLASSILFMFNYWIAGLK